MYRPELTIKANGLPVVSNDELDVIGERLVADFCPIATLVPQEIDIDRFVVNYLKMEMMDDPKYAPVKHDIERLMRKVETM